MTSYVTLVTQWIFLEQRNVLLQNKISGQGTTFQKAEVAAVSQCKGMFCGWQEIKNALSHMILGSSSVL